MDMLYCEVSQRELLWCVTDYSGYSSSSFHPHPQLSSSISSSSTFSPFDHGHGVTHTWSAVAFSGSMQGGCAGVHLVPVTSGFTQTVDHCSGGLPSPDEPCAQRRCRTFLGLCSTLPFQEGQPLELQDPSLCLSSRHRAPAVHDSWCPHGKDLQVQPRSVEVATSVVRASSLTEPDRAITALALLHVPGVGCPPPCPDWRRSEAMPQLPSLRPISPHGAAGPRGEQRRYQCRQREAHGRSRSMGGSCWCWLPGPPRLSLPSLMGNQRLIFSNPTV